MNTKAVHQPILNKQKKAPPKAKYNSKSNNNCIAINNDQIRG